MLAKQALIGISPAQALEKAGYEKLVSPPLPPWVLCWVEWNTLSSKQLAASTHES
jgi:hypothetical protein